MMVESVVQAQNATLYQQIAIAVAARALDAAKSQGEAVVELIKAAGQPGKAPGRGEHFDAVA